MKVAHTPGPWTVRPLLTPKEDDDPMGIYVVEPAFEKLTNAYHSAPVESDELDAVHAENRANKQLIEAGPEMIHALELAAAELNKMGCECDCQNMPTKCPVCAVNSAIEKASAE